MRDGDLEASRRPYERLAVAIIERAASDYREAMKKKDLEELERFFRSEWFGVLSPADPEEIIRRLRKERNENGSKRISYAGGKLR